MWIQKIKTLFTVKLQNRAEDCYRIFSFSPQRATIPRAANKRQSEQVTDSSDVVMIFYCWFPLRVVRPLIKKALEQGHRLHWSFSGSLFKTRQCQTFKFYNGNYCCEDNTTLHTWNKDSLSHFYVNITFCIIIILHLKSPTSEYALKTLYSLFLYFFFCLFFVCLFCFASFWFFPVC